MKQWISAMLILCILLTTPAAFAEAEISSEPETPAENVVLELGGDEGEELPPESIEFELGEDIPEEAESEDAVLEGEAMEAMDAVAILISESSFPDQNFRNFVLSTCDTDQDGRLSGAEIVATKKMDVSGLNIASLEGIDHFKALNTLDCRNNQLESLNLGGIAVLGTLRCNQNPLKALNISGCTRLLELYAHQTPVFGSTITLTDGTNILAFPQGTLVTTNPNDVPDYPMDRASSLTVAPNQKFRIIPGQLEVKEYFSSNPGVAGVNNGGFVTPLKEGTARIDLITSASSRIRLTLTVKDTTSVVPTGIALTNTLNRTLDIGKTLRLGYQLYPSNAVSDVKWSSSNTNVATVNGGLVTAKGKGTATITATTLRGNRSASVKLTVNDPTIPKSISINNPGSGPHYINTKLRLTYQLKPSGAVSNVKWSSSNTSVASVSGGTVTFKKAGTVTIKATTVRGGHTASIKLTVTDQTLPTSIRILKPSTTLLNVGMWLQLRTSMTPSTAKSAVTWTSLNKSVATVSSSGKVTAKKAGVATIKVTTKRGNHSATIRITVQQKNAQPTRVTINEKATLTLARGRTYRLKSTVYGPKGASTKVTWASNNTRVATVNSSGVVTAKAVGTARITVRTVNGKTDTIVIRVIRNN